ncbi:hypothetical protein J4G33_09160 [Actinotalea sp. BY-33]|uniref:SurA N-terminal domain-containing protein n=1 Tax=Actinotalea soli TaxID=2819234 RepID=A0A939LRZ2_9CELL|nr:hypothetical protein [Actinotalea soli]MBO1751970.1 hypothetical protein [Actinotalea soli]
MRVRTAAAVAAATTTAMLVAGCSTTPGAAAVVEGRTITQSTLDAAQQDLAPIFQGVDARTVLVGLIVAPYFLEAAAENGVAVSEEQAVEVVNQGLAESGQELPELSEGALEVLRFSLASQSLQQLEDAPAIISEVEAEIFEADVTINPRYGELDPETGQITAETLPWLHVGE